MGNQQTVHPNAVIITTLYDCFQRLDGEGMAQCYHPQAEFSDPVFSNLHGQDVGHMWRMLCARATDFRLEYRDITADENNGSASWKAEYKFSGTGRNVTNHVESWFEFRDGRIIGQRDSFSFWKWSCMALGPAGYLLGWTPLLHRKVQKQAMSNLKHFIEKQPAPARV